MGRLSYEWNRLDDADQYIHQCIDLCRQWGDIGLQAYAYAMLARLEQARNDPEKAREAMREAERLIGEHPLSPHWSIQVKSDLARVWLAQGNLERPSQLVQKRGLKIKDEIPYQRETEYVLLLRMLLARGDYECSHHAVQPVAATGRDDRADGIDHRDPDPSSAGTPGKERDRASPGSPGKSPRPGPAGGVRPILPGRGRSDDEIALPGPVTPGRERLCGCAAVQDRQNPAMTQPSMQLLVEPLTAREVEVLKLIEGGCSNQDIAEQLVISIPTVKRHISNIYTKLGVESRTQAVAIGKELRILE